MKYAEIYIYNHKKFNISYYIIKVIKMKLAVITPCKRNLAVVCALVQHNKQKSPLIALPLDNLNKDITLLLCAVTQKYGRLLCDDVNSRHLW